MPDAEPGKRRGLRIELTRVRAESIIFPMIQASGRSWWQVEYDGGRRLSEWDTVFGGLPTVPLRRHGSRSRWEEIDKRNIAVIRLLTPIGQASELQVHGNPVFQFKAGGRTAAGRKWVEGQVIGAVTSIDGDCVCAAWEVNDGRQFRPVRVIAQGPSFVERYSYRDEQTREMKTVEIPLQWQLVNFADNIRDMRYRHVGALSVENLSLKV